MIPRDDGGRICSALRLLVSCAACVAALGTTRCGENISIGRRPACTLPSAGGAFEFDSDAPNCVVSGGEGNHAGARYGRFYEALCPGRMTMEDMARTSRALASGTVSVPGNPITRDYGALSLTATFAYAEPDAARGITVRHSSDCTSFRFETKAITPNSITIADQCAEVNRAGSIAVGADLDIEFRCAIHLYGTERTRVPTCAGSTCTPPWMEAVAAEAIRRRTSVVDDARALGATVCLLNRTDIQCAPCTTSDKLVARMRIVRGSCPTSTLRALL
jgi:hypothetical protein